LNLLSLHEGKPIHSIDAAIGFYVQGKIRDGIEGATGFIEDPRNEIL
jgi:hypothetical protein